MTPTSRLAAPLVAAALAHGPATAGDWDVTPRVGVRQIYSDNIAILPPGREQHDWVTELTPGIDIRGTGRRLQADVFYTAQGLIYARFDNNSDLFHRLQANATAEVLEDFFFVDVGANLRQENISETFRATSDNINITGNRQDVFTVSVTPYVRRRFGNYADAELRLNLGTVLNSETGLDSDLGRFTLSVNSGSEFQRMPWDIVYERREERPNRGDEKTFNKVLGTGRYRINPRFGVVFGLGYESNEIQTNRQDPDAVIWKAGLTWTPNERVFLEFGGENRFFGLGPYLELRYRSRRITITGRYREEVTTSNLERADQRQVQTTDAFGNPITDANSDELLVNATDGPGLTDEAFVDRRFDGTISYAGRRSQVQVRAFSRDREYDVGNDENQLGVSGSVRYQMNALWSSRLFGNWSDREARDGVKTQTWDVGLAVTRTLGRTLSMTMDVRHVTQTSNEPLNEYDENRVGISLNKTF